MCCMGKSYNTKTKQTYFEVFCISTNEKNPKSGILLIYFIKYLNNLQININIKYIEMKRLKKALIDLSQLYLSSFPTPSDAFLLTNSLKLTVSYSNPFTNSKSNRQFIHLTSTQTKCLEPISRRLTFDEKTNRIEQSNSFNSILTQDKHQKVIQDDVFGKPKLSYNQQKWVYVAKVKEEKSKSYFSAGQGKKLFRGDFGEQYQDISLVGIYIWDKKKKKVHKIKIDQSLIPACPVWANEEGTKILFHAYKRQQFPHGLLHCFNRPVNIYQVTLEEDKEKQDQIKMLVETVDLKQAQTKIFAHVSPCYKWMTYFSGNGITHTYYLDLVIMKKEQTGKWVEHKRNKESFVGYYSTFKSYFLQIDGKMNLITQNIVSGLQQIIKVELESGNMQIFSGKEQGRSYTILDSCNNMIVGYFCDHQEKNFFYTNPITHAIQQVQILETVKNINISQYHQNIQAYYLQSDEVSQEFKHNKQKRPLCIIIHGGPHGAIEPTMTLQRFLLLRAGYGLLLPNFSGTAGFGKETLNKALGNVGTTNCDQIVQLLQRVLKDRPYLNKQKVHIMGGSFGGYMSAFLGGRNPQHFKSAVIMNGVLSIPGQLCFTDIPEWNTVETLKSSQLHNLRQKDYIQMFNQSPISYPMKIPTLQFLGAKDRRVPFRQGIMYNAITKLVGTQIQTYVYENSDHGLADSVETNVDIVIKTMIFLQKHNFKQEELPQKMQEKGIQS